MKPLVPEQYIKEKTSNAVKKAFDIEVSISVERPRQDSFGDFATTSALALARELKMAPRKIAEAIRDNISDENQLFDEITIDGPGFINFRLSRTYWHSVLQWIRSQDDPGRSAWGNGEKRQIEFVSANPTGPLNVVSARAAAVGDVLVSLLEKVGFAAEREYYINDAGRQIRLLGASVAARYMALFGSDDKIPEDGYAGEYIIELAKELKDEFGRKWVETAPDERSHALGQMALKKMIQAHKKAMKNYRVDFQSWFHESVLRENDAHLEILNRLKQAGFTSEKDGAIWFHSSEFGDAKDRVLMTREGEPTYFLVDISYHEDKYKRGFTHLLDLWGPDHHGYIDRMAAALQALGHEKESFGVRIIQQVSMLRNGEVVKMSKRAGNIIEMDEVLGEVGVDAARFFFVMRKLDSPLEFDIDLAQKKTDENPVFYIQYAHARMHNIILHAEREGIHISEDEDISVLSAPEEISLIKKCAEYNYVISRAARDLEPHQITNYLIELAGTFHGFYQKHRVVSEDEDVSKARLVLVECTRNVIKNALSLLKISAPERM